jgi:branched-chain amino acid transport system substrate-binding protein
LRDASDVRPILWLAGALATLAGCSLTRFDHQACKTHSDCRATFGFGSTCNAQGLCEQAPANARCSSAPFPDDLFSRPELYGDAIVIGSLMDHSSPTHLIREKAVRLAVKEVSAAGGLEGHKVAAVFCDIAQNSAYDTSSRSDAAVASALFLSDTLGIPAIVGPSASADAQLVWEALRASGTVIVSPAATSPALETLEPPASDGQPGSLWRVAPPDSLQGAVIAADMLERSISKAIVIRETGPYGEGLAQVFQSAFTAGKGDVQIQSIANDTQIGEAAATAAANEAAEVLFISSQQDWVIKFLNAASGQAAYMTKEIFLTDAAANAAVLTGAAAGAAIFPRVRGTRPAPRELNDYVFASFVANYKAEYAGEDATGATYSAHAYDGAWLVLYGAAWSMLQEGATTSSGIAHGLRKISTGAATPIIPSSWLGVVTAFRAGTSVDLSGASGEIDFDSSSKNVTAPIEIWNIGTANGQPAIAHVATKTPGG